MTKSEFIDWKNSQVTQEILKAIYQRVELGRDELESTAGFEPLLDSQRVGRLAAYRDILNVSYEEFE